ncbi:MAG TPA: hypothetical protein VGQ57_02295, partial [Polyangiaceae bacterium]|nr:hypothetical protein [Polyangiaceae bacterium]
MIVRRLLVAIPALCGLSLATLEARSQTASTPSEAAVADSVELKNGGYLRGLIVEVEPASHVSLRMPDGQLRRIPVAEIEAAERNGKPLVLAPPAPGATPSPVTPGAAVPGAAAIAGAPRAPAPPPPAPKHATSELDHL